MKRSILLDLELLIEPWIGGADDDRLIQAYAQLNPNDRESILAITRTELAPRFARLTTDQRRSIIRSMSEICSLSSEQIERMWESLLPPFSLPDDPRKLFEWVSEALPGEGDK